MEQESITSFFGECCWLSNFWPVLIEFEGIVFPSVEHAYVAAKTEDMKLRAMIAAKESPGVVKRLGKSLVIREGWDELRLPIMEKFLRQKFADPELRHKLLDTHPKLLVEGNNWGDKFWGVCNGVGENNLGKILMRIRAELWLEKFQG